MNALGLLALWIILGVGPAFADVPNPLALLKRSDDAEESRYAGELVTTIMGPKGPVNRRERVFRDGPKWRLEPAGLGPQQKNMPVVIVNGKIRQVYHPRQKLLTRYLLSGPKPSGPFIPELFRKNFQPRVTGEERVAGRPAWLVEVRRHKDQQLAWRVWIDKEKFLRLKTETYTADGRLRQSRAFDTIRFDTDLPPGIFEAPNSPELTIRTVALQTRTYEVLKREAEQFSFTLVDTRELEARYRYRFVGGDLTKDASERRIEEIWFRFTNGEKGLSLFQQRAGGMALPVEQMRGGHFTFEKNGWLITLVGAFSEAELRRLGDAIGVPGPPS